MQFSDSETQKLLRNTARSFLAEKYPWERLYAFSRGQAALTASDIKELADLGWLGLLAPESASGGSLSLLEAAVVIEEFGYAAVPAPVSANNIAACLLASATDGDATKSHLAGLAASDRLYTVCEAARRRGRHVQTGAAGSAGLSASGGKLQGVLPLVPFGHIADFVLAPLTVDGEGAFAAVPLEGAHRQPVRLTDERTYFNVHFDGADVDGLLVLAKGQQAGELHERCDALVTALSLVELAGMMQRVLEMTCEYISGRVQFGQPIAKFQAARHRAAELLILTDTTRWTAYHALWRFQEDPKDTAEIWLARHWAIRAAERVHTNSHLLHGGVGVGLDYPLHLFTLGMAGLAVRGGTMGEMAARIVESLEVKIGPR